MNKFLLALAVIVLVMMGVFFIASPSLYHKNKVAAPDYKNIEYMVEGNSVKLVHGYSEVALAPGSASKVITKYFGNEAKGDLDHDGISDVAFLITQESGGSGMFFYVVAAVKTNNGYQGTQAILLGDRIAPQVTEIHDGIITVHYVMREPGAPMTDKPSVGVSQYFRVENGALTKTAFVPTFSVPQKVFINTPVQFPDGLTVVIDAINDSRCKRGMACVWEGELSPHVAIAGGIVDKNDETFTLGTITKKSVILYGYTFTLQKTTETSVVLLVTKGN